MSFLPRLKIEANGERNTKAQMNGFQDVKVHLHSYLGSTQHRSGCSAIDRRRRRRGSVLAAKFWESRRANYCRQPTNAQLSYAFNPEVYSESGLGSKEYKTL
jgi:hypothetical protein